MAPPKRNSKRTSTVKAPSIPEDEVFTSADTFDFSAPAASPRMTRARRASISFEPPTTKTKANKRMSLAPTMPKLKEVPKATNKRRSMGPAVTAKKAPTTPKRRAKTIREDSPEFIFDPTPSRGITPAKKKVPGTPSKKTVSPSKGITTGNFYSSPTKPAVKGTLANPLAVSPNKKNPINHSPTKKFSKITQKILSEQQIEDSLMISTRAPTKTSSSSKAKTSAAPGSPSKKVANKKVNRTLTEKDIEASLMAEFDNTPPGAKIKPKTFETEIPSEKNKPRRREVEIKSPVVKAFKDKPATKAKASRIPIRSPPTTPVKAAFIPHILPVGSPVINAIIKEIKKVEIRLTPLKIKEDPNVIFSLLEDEHKNKNRVEKVVETLIEMHKENKPKTRKSMDGVDVVEKVKKEGKTPKKVKTPTVEAEDASVKSQKRKVNETPKTAAKPKTEKTPKVMKPKTPIASPLALNTPEIKETTKSTKAKTSKTPKGLVQETPKTVEKTAVKSKNGKTPKAKATETPITSRGTKRALENVNTPSSKRIKTEITSPIVDVKITDKTPKTKKVEKSPKSKNKKTPKAETVDAGKKSSETRGIKRAIETPETSKKRIKTEKSTPKAKSVKKSALKVTPNVSKSIAVSTLTLSALKKPLKRLSKAAAVTPKAQIRPADLLKLNMRQQVESAITAKVADKPDSSPYALEVTENNSPVFRKIHEKPEALKQHLTGTPARINPARTRKFGTNIQPVNLSLLEKSSIPSSKKSVSSSTPLRVKSDPSPHPLESVEATPIKAPTQEGNPVSSPPQMVTGKLGNMCSIM